MSLWLKVALTVALVVGSAEVAKHNARAAALLNALPFQSLIVLLWLYADTRDLGKVNDLSRSMLWVLPITFVFFVCLSILTRVWGHMWTALAASTAVASVVYGVMVLARRFTA